MEREKWNIARSNLRKRAVKRVAQLFDTLNNEECSVIDHTTEETNEEPGTEHKTVGSSFVLPPNCGLDGDRESESTSDEDTYDESGEVPVDLAACLKDWETHFGISLIALSALLCILKAHHPFLPKDARTLLKTQTCHSIASLANGSFHYFGVKKMFSHIFQKLTSVRSHTNSNYN